MNSLSIAFVAVSCMFGGSCLGTLLRRRLPEAHLTSDSKEVIKLGAGLMKCSPFLAHFV